MIVHDREPADGDGEDFRKFLQPKLDPFSAVDWAFAQQECATHAARDAVIPTSYGRVDEVGTGHCMAEISCVVDAVYPNSLAESIVHCLS